LPDPAPPLDLPERLNPGRLGPGCLVLVVGPSGAGKDTLIGYAREQLAGRDPIVFPRRVITREVEPKLEDHASVTQIDFQSMLAGGNFALHWQAHGLFYGIPRTIDDAIAAGATVIVNVSRSVVAAACERYARVLVVEVTAPADILAARLGQRGREDARAVEQRLARKAEQVGGADLVQIVNDGPVERAGDAFVALVEDRMAAQSV
jgi:ribose 1,5-bisphosphokinase